MKGYLTLVLILMVSVSCLNQNQSEVVLESLESDSSTSQFQQEGITKLIERKVVIDTLIAQKNLQLEVLAQQPNKEKPALVVNEEFPEELDRVYYIWRNSKEQILFIGEYPYSESGDWYIEYKHYFNEAGETFAFERITNFFNSICTDGVAHEVITEFYDSDFRRLHQVYSLADTEGNKLNKAECELPYDHPYEVSKSLEAYLERIKYGSK